MRWRRLAPEGGPQEFIHMKNNGASEKFMTLQGEGGDAVLRLAGAWTIYNAAAIEEQIAAFQKDRQAETIPVWTDGIEDIDTAGVWLIKKHFAPNPGQEHVSAQQKALLDFLPAELKSPRKKPHTSSLHSLFSGIGETAAHALNFAYAIFIFIGRVFSRLVMNFLQPRHFRFPSIIRHIYETGILAVPIISLLAILMSMVISYQAAVQLQKFGADLFTIDLSVISILREMGVLITAIMVAGRSGSAFAAEIGVMKMNEEVDALRTIGMDPIEVLVIPRLIALLVVLPLLTFIADVVGLAGSGVMSFLLLDIPFHQFLDRAQGVVNPTLFFVGMIKAPVFAFLIAIIGTFQGMNVSGSAESVGRMTTIAVVQSIFLVIMADALFSIIFSRAGI